MALGSNSGMGFLRTNDLQLAYSELKTGEFVLDYGILVKIVEVNGVQIENKLNKNMKKTSLKHWATGLRS